LVLLLRNRLKYALTRREVTYIVMQRHVKVDAKVRTDANFPAGFMDVVSIEKTKENFRLLYDVKGRFAIHRIGDEEAKYKLAKVRSVALGAHGIPYLTTSDARTIRYPDPLIKVADTVKIDLATGKISDFVRFDIGNLVMITGGRNVGRVGVIESKEKHPGSYDIVHIKDAAGAKFATRADNVFAIGKGTKSLVSLPRGKGVKLSIVQERDKKFPQKAAVSSEKPAVTA